jgi:hypothetical protein
MTKKEEETEVKINSKKISPLATLNGLKTDWSLGTTTSKLNLTQ